MCENKNKHMESMIGKKFYVFTNWGLCKAVVVKERTDEKTGVVQYKVKIDVDRETKNRDYGFWFNSKQLNKYYFTAIILEMFKPFGWFVKSLFKK